MSRVLRFCRTAAEYEAWDQFVSDFRGAHYCQLYGWLSSYEPMGFDPEVMIQLEGERIVGGAAFLSFKLPVVPWRAFILPHGPLCDEADPDSWDTLMAGLDEHFRQHGAIYAQAWPHVVPDDVAGLERFAAAGYQDVCLFRAHEFSSTLLAIDIGNRREEEILAGFRKQTRYYCRRSLKSGLELRLGRSDDDLRASYELLEESGRYHGYQPRPYRSLATAFERLVPKGRALLLQVWTNGELAGTIFVIFAGRIATYYAAATSRAHASLYPSEFLHLHAIRLAQQHGMEVYDLMNWSDPGVAQFKRGFRPRECRWTGPRTKIYRPFLARCTALLEKRLRPLVRSVAQRRAR